MWWTRLALPEGDTPLGARIADAVVAEIQRGRLQHGDRLPGTRALASSLGVHRNTVVAAFAELRAQGWVRTRPGGGTYVAVEPPPLPQGRAAPDRPGFAHEPVVTVEPAWEEPGMLALAGGRPDLRLVPVDEIARAWRRGLRRKRHLLGYGDPAGHPALREGLVEMLATERGVIASPERVIVTRGSQMALFLLARALIRPGDRIAVEAYGYPPAWAAFRAAGATLVPIPVDEGGIRVDALESALPLRAVYVTPHHQFPTMVVLDPARRASLLEFAGRHRVAVIEDDYDNEFHYAGRPVLPLASADRAGVVLYVGTLSKVLAPGLRVGFCVGPTPVIRSLVALRTIIDRQGDLATEAALAELLADGSLQRHLRRARRIYRHRQQVFANALTRHLGDAIHFERPPGGLALWARTATDVEAWAARCRTRRVTFTTGRAYRFDGAADNAARLGFGGLEEHELEQAARAMAEALP